MIHLYWEFLIDNLYYLILKQQNNVNPYVPVMFEEYFHRLNLNDFHWILIDLLMMDI
jgi:hypothetical protein